MQEAIECLTSLVTDNENLINKLGEGLKFESGAFELAQPNSPKRGAKKQFEIFNMKILFGSKPGKVEYNLMIPKLFPIGV